VEDLRVLANKGVEILTCGTCLNYYQLTDKLVVGGVTNMYDIVEKQEKAARIIRP
jgi:intracellular sulfur oxidation DsrE/DsrF family protein